MKNNVRESVEGVVKRTLQIGAFPKDFRSDTPLTHLGIDSVLLLEIIVSLESEMNITIADESLSDVLVSSVDGLVQLVEAQRGSEEST